ncbi:hypothetical protein K7432_003827 [Basidiobolus ranarum]|uniref:NAD(P)-binding domain-containing protein n=1 Tax=Basidiobolus ranarum TaxID=34480 RepID=A0ABR2WZ90_9FUNG
MNHSDIHKPTVCVVGADLFLGLRICSYLLSLSHRPFEVVRAVVKDTNLNEKLEGFGCEVVKADFDDQEALTSCFRNFDWVVILPYPHPERVRLALSCVEASDKAHVENILCCTFVGVDSQLSSLREFKELEDRVTQSPAQTYILRLTFLLQTFLWWRKNFFEKNALSIPIGEGEFAPLDASNVCQACAEIMEYCTMVNRHQSHTYILTGPKLLTGDEIAKVASDTLKVPIVFDPVTRDECRQYLESVEDLDLFRTPENVPYRIETNLDLCELVRRREMNFVTEDMMKLTGTRGKSVAKYFEENAESFHPPAPAFESSRL